MYRQYLSFVIELAKEAGQFILSYAEKSPKQTMESMKELVTKMEIDAERFITHRIREHYPKHGIFSEEMGRVEGVTNR